MPQITLYIEQIYDIETVILESKPINCIVLTYMRDQHNLQLREAYNKRGHIAVFVLRQGLIQISVDQMLHY